MTETDALGQQGSQDNQPNQQDEATRTQQAKDALAEAIRKRKQVFGFALLSAIAFLTLSIPSHAIPKPGCDDRRDDQRDECKGKLYQTLGEAQSENTASQVSVRALARPSRN